MEQELNIAAILKDKPKGTKLYSPIFGECVLSRLTDSGIKVFPKYKGYKSTTETSFFNSGIYMLAGEICLFPSKQMQDWSKFAWKKGDVLISKDTDSLCVFDSFEDDTYSTFNAKYYHNPLDFSINLGVISRATEPFTKVDDDEAKNFIRKIGEHYGGKLNLKTLEIEHEPQFKDGDIVYSPVGDIMDEAIFIAKVVSKGVLHNYIYMSKEDMIPLANSSFGVSGSLHDIRLATDSEKQQLFEALAKEGKRWNSETKTLEDLPKKCEFNPFDKVLVRDVNDERWKADFFSYYDITNEYNYICIGGDYKQCTPYNDQTAHLLGTTDDWEGGEE